MIIPLFYILRYVHPLVKELEPPLTSSLRESAMHQQSDSCLVVILDIDFAKLHFSAYLLVLTVCECLEFDIQHYELCMVD